MGRVTDLVTIVDRPNLLPVWLYLQLPEQLVLAVPVRERKLGKSLGEAWCKSAG